MAKNSSIKPSLKFDGRPNKKSKTIDNSPARQRPKVNVVKSQAPAGKVSRHKVLSETGSGSATTKATKSKGKEKAVLDSDNQNSTTTFPTTFKVVAGSYEKLLYGLEGTVTVEDSSLQYTLRPIFIFPAHISSIKAIAASPDGGKWLATGSADEIVRVWDLRRRKEIGGLMQHEGSITYLGFPSRSHLLSASEDGTLALFRARDWSILRSLKGHKGRVNCVAAHPSGKVALSVGKDRTLRMWDLMRGKASASTKLGKEGELVRWSTDGKLFVVQSLSTIDVYNTDMELLQTVTHPSRLHDIKFCKLVDAADKEVLLAAGEDNKLSIYEIPVDTSRPPRIIAEMIGHSNRVKAVDTLRIATPALPNSKHTSTTIVSTISSDGKVHLYDLAVLQSSKVDAGEKPQFEPIAEYDTKGSRLTCMTLAEGDISDAQVWASTKRKRSNVDSDGEDESGEAAGSGEDEEDMEEDEEEGQEEVEEE